MNGQQTNGEQKAHHKRLTSGVHRTRFNSIATKRSDPWRPFPGTKRLSLMARGTVMCTKDCHFVLGNIIYLRTLSTEHVMSTYDLSISPE